MLYWSERIYHERGIEPPNRGRLEWALTQAARLLELCGQAQADRKRERDLYEGHTSDTLSDAGARPRIKRTKTQSSRTSHDNTELPKFTSCAFINDPRILSVAPYNATNTSGAIGRDSKSVLAYAGYRRPGSRIVSLDEAMQYFTVNPPRGNPTEIYENAMQYFVHDPLAKL